MWWKKKDKKPKEPTAEEKAKAKQMESEQEKFKQQKVLEGLIAQEQKYETRIENESNAIKAQEAEIKNLIKAGQKDKAKRLLKTVKQKRDNLINLQNKQGFISKQKIQLEALQDDAGMIDAVKDANQIMQKGQEKQEEFREQLELAKE